MHAYIYIYSSEITVNSEQIFNRSIYGSSLLASPDSAEQRKKSVKASQEEHG